MSRKAEIATEIDTLHKKIEEYKKCIEELKQIYVDSKNRAEMMVSEVFLKISGYDIFQCNTWNGNTADKADEQKNVCVKSVMERVGDSEKLLDDIKSAIRRYKEMISRSEEKIRRLRKELSKIKE